MSGAFASATRAQWAGYEAPDEREDEWPVVSLPSEMMDEYGSPRVFDFSVHEDRAILGFQPLPSEQADTLAEELEGVIDRLADLEYLSPESLCLVSSANELHQYPCTGSTSLPASSPSPPDTPLPDTPLWTREATTGLGNDLFAAYLYDSPVADKTINASSMSQTQWGLQPMLQPRSPRPPLDPLIPHAPDLPRVGAADRL
ncbi:hypothetical protein CspeluHIS016_0112030 [Cutaneotrichosporon spelunceum]|uniref:Uncharacterized protein n=1 Tax=Cutaneotrichosporon spelunceum TaxID=1672016 RepID=A0AAD3TPW0_9TREE|nr:hypothetical protein CspeluHIS016_0112030 [Cutaneotrichosporon spelunceum]